MQGDCMSTQRRIRGHGDTGVKKKREWLEGMVGKKTARSRRKINMLYCKISFIITFFYLLCFSGHPLIKERVV